MQGIHIHFIGKGTDFKFEWSFLRPILAEIDSIFQKPTIPQLGGVHPSSGVLERIAGGPRDGLLCKKPSPAIQTQDLDMLILWSQRENIPRL